MKIIYEPKGAALEYAPLAANLYSGCVHGCRYCFVPGVMRKTRETFHAKAEPRKDVIRLFEDDCMTLAGGGDDREILLSFATDPYQPVELSRKITRTAIMILKAYDLRFTILTKGGDRAVLDFDLLEGYGKCSFGQTIIFDSPKKSRLWEPGAADPGARYYAAQMAHAMGIKTWISLEPILDFDETLRVVDAIGPYINHWKIGKINHHKYRMEPEWRPFCVGLKRKLDAAGADYFVKDSLKPYWPKDLTTFVKD